MSNGPTSSWRRRKKRGGKRRRKRKEEGGCKGKRAMAKARKRNGDGGRYEYGGGRGREMRYDEQNRAERAEIPIEQIEIKT
jgi:hypothetical protein